MPTHVRWFERLMYLAFVVVGGDFLVRGQLSNSVLALAVAAQLGVIALLIWLAARRRQNWARWLLFALFILETAAFASDAHGYIANPRIGLVHLVVTLLEATAYWFVFTGNSRAWFGKDEPDITVF